MKKVLQTTAMFIAISLGAKAQLVAHYEFTNGSGIDISGNNLNGLATDVTDTIDRSGNMHQAVVITDYTTQPSGVEVPHNSSLNFTNHISIATWIKPYEIDGVRKIVDKLDGTTTGNFELDILNGILRFWVASGHTEQASRTMSVGTWYHIVATYDGANAKIYINAQLAASSPVTGNCVTNASNMLIGYGQNGTDGLHGTMDDLKIYSNTLSSTDVTNLYNSENTGLYYAVATSANLNNGGTTSGGGIFAEGATATVSATANAGYHFDFWAVNGEDVSSSNSYSIVVNSDKIVTAVFTPTIPTNGLISKWSFNNGNADDEIGSDNGTVNGATLTTDRFDNANQAYSFDGVDDEIDFAGSSIDAADFTISFWVKTATHNYKTIVSKWATGNGGFQFEDYPSLRYVLYTSGGTMRTAMPTATSVDNWHHVVLTNQFSDSASLYIDGTRVASDATSFAGQTITGTPRLFLGSTNLNSNNFAGDIDDVFIYNRVLNDAEVTQLYNDGTIVPCAATSSNITDSICANGTYSFGGELLNTAGVYYDTLTNVGGCDSVITLTLTEKTTNCVSGITDTSKENVSVYPNPFSDKLEISGEIAYQLYNVLGQKVYSTARKEGLSALPKGNYVLKSAAGTARVVKE